MDRPSHPHVIRTWAVDRIRSHSPATSPHNLTPERNERNKTRPVKTGSKRRKP
jgi:hypothetical protein